MLSANDIKQQFDNMQAYSKGYAAALEWVAQKSAEETKGEKKGDDGDKDAKVDVDTKPTKASK